MNTISKAHQRFSNHLNEPRVLEYPQEFLGPNYEAVLNFWLFFDELSEDQWKTIECRYWDFCFNQYSEMNKAIDEARKVSKETIGRKFANHSALVFCGAPARATQELIGMHLILDKQKPLTFFNMFLES